jgi:hypothetical protein
MMRLLKIIMAFFFAVVTSHLLTSIVGTQFVLANIRSYGLTVSMSDRFTATVHDIHGLVPTLPMLIGVTFLVAFMVAAVGHRFLHGDRKYWYMAAGFTSLPAAMMLIKATLGANPFAAAGSVAGLLFIGICGLAGACLFARLTLKKEA